MIYRLINGPLAAGQPVTVSFDGVPAAPSSFINGAFIRLLETIPFERVKQRLKVVDSTKHINDLLRSRFEFVSTGGSVKDGIYHVRFMTGIRVTAKNVGEGLVVAKTGTVNGGDAGFIYQGTIYGTEDLTATLHVRCWNPGHVSIFGTVSRFDLALSGKRSASDDSFLLSGFVASNPDMRISIAARFLADAV